MDGYDPMDAVEESGPTVTVREAGKVNVDFSLRNVDLAFANSLRRVILAEIPTIAIDLIEVKTRGFAKHSMIRDTDLMGHQV